MILVKEIVHKGDKRYTNFLLKIRINEKNYTVPIMPKTFGKDYTHPQVRQAFTLLDLASSEIIEKERKE